MVILAKFGGAQVKIAKLCQRASADRHRTGANAGVYVQQRVADSIETAHKVMTELAEDAIGQARNLHMTAVGVTGRDKAAAKLRGRHSQRRDVAQHDAAVGLVYAENARCTSPCRVTASSTPTMVSGADRTWIRVCWLRSSAVYCSRRSSDVTPCPSVQ